MNLFHYAEEPVTLDRSRTYVQREPSTYGKPRGFWVSVEGEDDWPTWCRDVDYAPERLATTHNVRLADEANILTLATPQALDDFTERFGIRDRKSFRRHSWEDVSIPWAAVASEYAGIIIAPYRWDRRAELDWYYGWDVASGCIWDLTAIESVTAVSFAMTERPL